MSDIILVLLLLVAAYYLQRSSNRAKQGAKKEKAADWLQVKNIDADGLITTEDDRFLLMLEVQPVSFALKSPVEQKMIWLAFRDCINMIPHPTRYKSESHPYDLEDYFQDVKARAVELDDLANTDYVEELHDMFKSMIELNQIQDRKYYVFLETDSRFLSELAADVSNPVIHDLLKRNKQNQQSVYDMDTIRQELMNSLRIIQASYHNVGIWTYAMRREEVIQYFDKTTNREIAGVLPLEEMLLRTAARGEPVQSFGKTLYEGAS
ncbi:hypothetical protein [Paenibacillus sp. Leaf72]|uniref:hypothetical protein n=1 Tax=Paenibacillus sp. Leaf72 TaxID=1736234 RepID=UPI0006F4AAC7|nr:hypothetical protein [Paenibacillus sp. Leaf72]KQN97036.1 hypothetical protein ASF12_23490 [Paenibacillus sp. Leaf72]